MEEAMLVRFRQGDEQVFTDLYNRCFTNYWYQARYYLKDEEEARDVVAEAFLQLWKRRPDFASEQKIMAFLAVTVRHACLSLCQKKNTSRKHEAPLSLHLKREGYIGPDTDYAETVTHLWRQLQAEIEHLPSKKRSVLELTAQGLSDAAIAATLRMSAKSVKNHRSLAIKALRLAAQQKNLPHTLALISILELLYQPPSH